MTDLPPSVQENLRRAAEHYGVTYEEAVRRYTLITGQGGNPEDPICIGCAKRPHEIDGYRVMVMAGPGDTPSDEAVRQYVIEEEGTYNPANGHFLCDEDYIKSGMPSSPGGWRAP